MSFKDKMKSLGWVLFLSLLVFALLDLIQGEDQQCVDCNSNPCRNGGECISKGSCKFICKCPALKYGGRYCEIDKTKTVLAEDEKAAKTNVCASNKTLCENDGICISGFKDSYKCKCTWRYSGQNCEYERDPCESEPCEPDAETCVKLDWHVYRCIKNTQASIPCPDSECLNDQPCLREYDFKKNAAVAKCNCGLIYDEPYCEVKDGLPPCLPDPCQNHGLCKNVVENEGDNATAVCTCPLQYQGEWCEEEKVVVCQIRDCRNGGVCAANGTTANKIKCDCPDDYVGDGCDYHKDSPCGRGACNTINTHKCVLKPRWRRGYKCICKYGWAGVFCDYSEELISTFNARLIAASLQ